MKFDKLVESLLLEMPWLDFKSDDKQFAIDLEMEKYFNRDEKKFNWESFLSILVKILNSEEYTDKRNEKIQLTTDAEKEKFISTLKGDMIFDSYRRKFPLDTEVPKQLINLFN